MYIYFILKGCERQLSCHISKMFNNNIRIRKDMDLFFNCSKTHWNFLNSRKLKFDTGNFVVQYTSQGITYNHTVPKLLVWLSSMAK